MKAKVDYKICTRYNEAHYIVTWADNDTFSVEYSSSPGVIEGHSEGHKFEALVNKLITFGMALRMMPTGITTVESRDP